MTSIGESDLAIARSFMGPAWMCQALLDRTAAKSLQIESADQITNAVDVDGPAWRPRPRLNVARGGLDVATVAGSILAIGGFATNFAEFYDIVEARDVRAPGVWKRVQPMRHRRSNAAVAVLAGSVYVAGGGDETGSLDVVERFDPRTKTWDESPPIPQPRVASAAAAHDGQLYLSGGGIFVNDQPTVTDSVLVFDPDRGTWSPGAPLCAPRIFHRMVTVGGYLYVVGGVSANGGSLSTVERYDPRADEWTPVASMNRDRGLPGITTIRRGRNRYIVVVGGSRSAGFQTDKLRRTTEVYHVNTNRWRMLPSRLPRGRTSLICAEDADGAILAIGGIDDLPEDATRAVHALAIDGLTRS